MEVQIVREVRLIEGIHERGPTLGNVARAKEFPDHSSILSFNGGVIIGLTGRWDAVTAIKNLPKRAATCPLLYPEPLSEWKPCMVKGNVASSCS
ncbi:MAG: hypothetical protein CO149_03425, partial [Nitrospirae bacterium CG_4_9_14_3_um_filter_51_5]